MGSVPGLGRLPWRRKWKPTPVFLPGKFNEQRSLADDNPWGCKESDTNEYVHTHTHTYTQKFPVEPEQNYWCISPQLSIT